MWDFFLKKDIQQVLREFTLNSLKGCYFYGDF